jgi:hypothetical protein
MLRAWCRVRPGAPARDAGTACSRWSRIAADDEDPERIAIREALAFGKALYDRRVASA